MKFKIIANPKKEWASELVKEVEALLKESGHAVTEKNADVTICIGGDGTILYSNHKKILEGPVIAIGTETSYICQLKRKTWKEELPKLLETGNKITVMTLIAKVGDEEFSAINDFVVHAKDYRVLEITVDDSEKTQSFHGDGLIVSSALGSAGYAYSAGGDKLDPKERKISIVPICPYKRTFLPVSFDENKRIKVHFSKDCAFITDGIFLKNLKKDENVLIEKGNDITFFEGVGD